MRPFTTARMHPSARRYLRAGFWLWTFVASLGATVGALAGWLEAWNETNT